VKDIRKIKYITITQSNVLKFILTAASFIKRVARSVVFCVVFVLYIIVYPLVLFSFTHCIVCRFSIFGFWLSLLYFQFCFFRKGTWNILFYFIYLFNQTYWQTTVTEPGWSTRQEETLFRRSNIHFPDDGTLSVFHSVIDTTRTVVFLFVSYTRKVRY
jgi:hypothetical protein